MSKAKKVPESKPKRRSQPALGAEARENQLIALAYDLVEQRLLDGTATSQETTHFLKLGSMRNRYEMEKLKRENELLVAKKEALQSAQSLEELYTSAMNAMKGYRGEDD